MTIPTADTRAAWRAIRDVPRSRAAAVLHALAVERKIPSGRLRDRLIAAYGAEAELLPTVPTGRPSKRAPK